VSLLKLLLCKFVSGPQIINRFWRNLTWFEHYSTGGHPTAVHVSPICFLTNKIYKILWLSFRVSLTSTIKISDCSSLTTGRKNMPLSGTQTRCFVNFLQSTLTTWRTRANVKAGTTPFQLTRGSSNYEWHRSWKTAYLQLGNIVYTVRYQYGRLAEILTVDLMLIINKVSQLGMCNLVLS
jgi:hypothetical protein